MNHWLLRRAPQEIHPDLAGRPWPYDKVFADPNVAPNDIVYLTAASNELYGWGYITQKKSYFDEELKSDALQLTVSRPVVRPNLVAASEIQTNSNLSTLFENSHRNLFALSAIQVNALNGLIRSKGVDAPADVDTSGVRNELTQKERLPSIKKPKGTRKSKRKSA